MKSVDDLTNEEMRAALHRLVDLAKTAERKGDTLKRIELAPDLSLSGTAYIGMSQRIMSAIFPE